MYVDGKKVAGLRTKEQVSLDLPVGRHVAYGRMDWVRSSELELDIADGVTAGFEGSMTLSAGWAWFGERPVHRAPRAGALRRTLAGRPGLPDVLRDLTR